MKRAGVRWRLTELSGHKQRKNKTKQVEKLRSSARRKTEEDARFGH
jgi:hypothetical protein